MFWCLPSLHFSWVLTLSSPILQWPGRTTKCLDINAQWKCIIELGGHKKGQFKIYTFNNKELNFEKHVTWLSFLCTTFPYKLKKDH